jgi:lipoate synthase
LVCAHSSATRRTGCALWSRPPRRDHRALVSALSSIVECLRVEVETLVCETHPVHEGAVAAHFDYAHSLSVLQRLQEMGSEVEAMIEVVTGLSVDGVVAASFHFPD